MTGGWGTHTNLLVKSSHIKVRINPLYLMLYAGLVERKVDSLGFEPVNRGELLSPFLPPFSSPRERNRAAPQPQIS